jgi:hypothetical protein
MMRRLASSLVILLIAPLAVAVAPACRSGQKTDAQSPTQGEGQSAAGGGDEANGAGADQSSAGAGEESEESQQAGGAAEEEKEGGATGKEPEGAPAAVTFVLKNSHDQELAFNMDLGWQPNLFAYTGKPPKAVSILMFPKFCTASCDVAAEERCPICPQPENAKDILAAQKMERVAPGEELEVPWDGQMFVYEKGRGKNKERCECHRTEPAPAGTYTVKACGLRLTTTAEERSRLQCVEGKMVLPAEESLRVELDFGSPSTPGKAGAKTKHTAGTKKRKK